MKPTVYLAGPITGTTYGECTDWREYARKLLETDIACFSPMRGKTYLLNETSVKDTYDQIVLSSQRGIFARDSFDCRRCDAILVNLTGAVRVSIGTVMEIAWANAHNKVIVLVMEKEGNIHEHAMLREACPFRVETLDEGLSLIRTILLP